MKKSLAVFLLFLIVVLAVLFYFTGKVQQAPDSAQKEQNEFGGAVFTGDPPEGNVGCYQLDKDGKESNSQIVDNSCSLKAIIELNKRNGLYVPFDFLVYCLKRDGAPDPVIFGVAYNDMRKLTDCKLEYLAGQGVSEQLNGYFHSPFGFSPFLHACPVKGAPIMLMLDDLAGNAHSITCDVGYCDPATGEVTFVNCVDDINQGGFVGTISVGSDGSVSTDPPTGTFVITGHITSA